MDDRQATGSMPPHVLQKLAALLCLAIGLASIVTLPVLAQTATSLSAATAQPSAQGWTNTASSQGRTRGCVRWSYVVEPKPERSYPAQVILMFTFVNKCKRPIMAGFARQSGGGTYSANALRLETDQVYSGSGKAYNYIIFDPGYHQNLRFWPLQAELSEQRIAIDLRGCPVKGPPRREFPPCPPYVNYSGF